MRFRLNFAFAVLLPAIVLFVDNGAVRAQHELPLPGGGSATDAAPGSVTDNGEKRAPIQQIRQCTSAPADESCT